MQADRISRERKAPDGNGDFGQALLDASLPSPDGVIGPDGKPAPKRFNVYRNNVIVSLIEALGDTFVAVRRLLGDEYFGALAREYIIRHPPTSPVLIWYGKSFPDFMAGFPPLQAYPYIADVGRLEWAWLQSYHAADAEPLDPAVLGDVAPDAVGQVRIERHPAARLIPSPWPIYSLIQANRFAPDDPPAVDIEEGQDVLVARPEIEVDLLCLPPGGAAFLEALFDGAALEDAAGRALTAAPEFQLPVCLQTALSAGVFSALVPDNGQGHLSAKDDATRGAL